MAKAKTKFPTKAQLNSIRIFNPWGLGQLAPDRFYISTMASMGASRKSSIPQVQIIHYDQKTDPDGPWYNEGRKTFIPKSGRTPQARNLNKLEALKKAMDFCEERFGPREWVRDPFGGYQDIRVLGIVWAQLEAAKAGNV